MANGDTTLDLAFLALVIDDDGRACRDIPDAACREEPRNFFTHVAALSLSKSADALVDPKLVLSWLLTTLGAPALVIGFLVPVRESGALLPQLFTAGAIRRLKVRKFAWAAGAFIQGVAAAGIGLAGATLSGARAGWTILGLLTVLALARSVCSVSYKDVLGKTVSKSRRGSATGLAGSIAAGAAVAFAMLLIADALPRMDVVIGGLFVAGGLWAIASLLFATLEEAPGATEGGASAFKAALENVNYLKTDPQLVRFIAVRALLTVTALAPPFMIAAGSGSGESGLEGLGFLVFASAAAGLVSSYVWGRLADQSSRKVLILSAGAGALALGATATMGWAGYLSTAFVLPALLFALMVAYQGVRLGRSTHLVDMADEDTRAAYTALSNTAIGVVLIAGGVFGLIAQLAGALLTLAIMAGLCALAAFVGIGLKDVQKT